MYRKDSGEWLQHIDFILWDMLCLQAAFILAYLFSGYGWNPYESILYRSMAIYLGLADLIVIFAWGTLKGVVRRGHYREFLVVLQQTVILGAAALVYLFLLQAGQLYSRKALLWFVCLYLGINYIVRELWKLSLHRRRKDNGKKSLLIVATKDSVEQAIKQVQEHNIATYTIIGAAVIDAAWTGRSIRGIDVVANAETLSDYVCQAWVDEILIVVSDEVPYPQALISQLTETGVTIHLSLAKTVELPGKKQFVEKIGGYTVLTTSMNYASTGELLIKRLMDIIAGVLGCIATAVIFVFVAPAICISSPGPVFFAQERVGKNGKRFKMYKFRSMYLDAEERKAELMKDNKLGDGKMFKLDFDPRVIGNRILPDGRKKTGIGDFIRRTSLDEFPQFFNVLKGDMSLVGTRPPLISETNLYKPHHHARLAIKPGITGMWQVSGRSDITDFEEVVDLDKEYISNWNIGLDIKILLKTILVVFRKEGSV